MLQQRTIRKIWFMAVLPLLSMGCEQADARTTQGQDVHVTGGGGSEHWTPNSWTSSQHYAEVSGFAPRPSVDVLEKITVEWSPPEMDKLGNFCLVHVVLRIPAEDPQRTRPIDWFQGLTVYMASASKTTPDWSHGMDQDDTVHDTGRVNENGEWTARLDMRETDYDRAAAQSFQFGIALAKHSQGRGDSQDVEWSSDAAAIEQSVQMLNVPAAPEISPELALVNRAAAWPFQDHDTSKLIQAVNALHRQGKDEALRTLDEYDRLVRLNDDYWEKEHITFWIIRALFEPVRLDERMHEPALAVHLSDRNSPAYANWPLSPMAIINDVPFMVGRQVNLGGRKEPASSYISWARKYGVLRDEPLRPTSPLQAAQEILGSRRFEQLDEYEREGGTQAIREQTIAMLHGAVANLPELSHREAKAEQQWQDLLERVKGMDFQWDEERQRFVVK